MKLIISEHQRLSYGIYAETGIMCCGGKLWNEEAEHFGSFISPEKVLSSPAAMDP